MGFLADLGRSNAGINMVKGLSDLTSDIQNRRVQQEQLNMQQAEETRKASLFAEGERARQLRQKPIIIDDAYWNGLGVDMYPETKEALVKNAISSGFVNKDAEGNLVTNLENVDNYKKYLASKKELAGEVAQVTYTTASKNIKQTQAQIDEIKSDPTWQTNKKSVETVAALQKQMQVHNQKRSIAYDAWVMSNEDLAKEKVKAEMKDERSMIGNVSPDKYTTESLGKFAQTRNYTDLVPIASETKSPIGTISPDKFTPESLVEFVKTNNYGALVPIDKPNKSLIGTINPKDFTPESIKTFTETNDYGTLVPIDKESKSPIGTIEPHKFTSESLAAFIHSGDYSVLVPMETKKDPKALIGTINPKDFTPESLAKFIETGDYGVLTQRLEDKEKDPASAFKLFYKTNKDAGKTDDWIDKEWNKRQEKLKMVAPATNVFIGTNPDTGNPIIMPSRGKPTMTEVNAPAGGIAGKNVSEDYKKDVTAIKQAKDLVATLKKQWQTLGITNRGSAVGAATKGRLGTDANAKVYMDAKTAFLGNLSRSIAAERGVLTEQDIQRINGVVANVGFNPFMVDSAAEANKKWGMIDEIIKSAEKRMKERKGITFKTDENTIPVKQSGRFTVKEIK